MQERYILGPESAFDANIGPRPTKDPTEDPNAEDLNAEAPAAAGSEARTRPYGGRFRPSQAMPLFRRGALVEHVPVAREERSVRDARGTFASEIGRTGPIPARIWEGLSEISPDSDVMSRNNLFPLGGDDPVMTAFDMLRSRLLQGLGGDSGSRIAITSPTHGCGKSFVALNLAFSLARRAQSRAALVDLDLRRPTIAGLLGAMDIPPLAGFLTGEQPLEMPFRRLGKTLALGLNGQPVAGASDLLHHPAAGSALASIQDRLAPEVTLYDLPPALVCDDVMAMAGLVDGVLLVADGTRSAAADIRTCERLFEGRLPLLGVVLNRAQDPRLSRYRYGRG